MPRNLELTFVVIIFASASGLLVARVVSAFSGRSLSALAMAAICCAAALWAIIVVPFTIILAATLCLAWALIALAAVDLLAYRLPDLLTFPLIALGLLVALLLPSEHILDHVAAALLGYAAFALIAWLYQRLRGQDGLGLGDAKLAAAAGAWLGVAALPSVLLLASVTGILWIAARTLISGRAALTERIAFGLPLCLAIWLVWLYGPFDFAALAP